MKFKDILEFDLHATNRLRMDKEKNGWWKWVAFLAHSGDSWFWLAGLGLIWLFSARLHEWAAFWIIAILALATLVMGIKFTVRRSRPPGDWGAVYRNTDPHSFPSGHAARAMMLAVLAIGTGPLWLVILMVLWAPLVSLSRVFTGMHYLSDVAAGMVLGLLAGKLFLLGQPLIQSIFFFVF